MLNQLRIKIINQRDFERNRDRDKEKIVMGTKKKGYLGTDDEDSKKEDFDILNITILINDSMYELPHLSDDFFLSTISIDFIIRINRMSKRIGIEFFATHEQGISSFFS